MELSEASEGSSSGAAAAQGVREHVPALDGVRGVAILLVLIIHSLGLQSDPDNLLLFQLGRAGWVGVDLFFVLSGFLITGILLDHLGHPGVFKSFYARRALRIFPLYYAFLAVLLGAGALISGLQTPGFQQVWNNQGWLWLYATNIKLAFGGNFNDFGFAGGGWVEAGHFWSLAVEEQFYLFWPLALLLVGVGRARALTIAVCVLAFASRYLLVESGHLTAAYVSMPCRMDALGAGALVAVLAREPGGLQARRRYFAVGFAVFGAAILGLGFSQEGYEHLDPEVIVYGYSLNAAFFGCLIALAVTASQGSPLRRALSARWLRSLGRYSYAIYILHLPLVKILLEVSATREFISGRFGGVIVLAVVLPVAYALARLTWAYIEQPCLSLKSRFPLPGAGAAGSLERA